MDEIEGYFRKLRSRLDARDERTAEVVEELRTHVEDAVEELMAKGMPRHGAVALALDRLGDPADLAAAFNAHVPVQPRGRRGDMQCQECSERAAVLHASEIEEGRLSERHLCEDCALLGGYVVGVTVVSAGGPPNALNMGLPEETMKLRVSVLAGSSDVLRGREERMRSVRPVTYTLMRPSPDGTAPVAPAHCWQRNSPNAAEIEIALSSGEAAAWTGKTVALDLPSFGLAPARPFGHMKLRIRVPRGVQDGWVFRVHKVIESESNGGRRDLLVKVVVADAAPA